MVDVPPAVAAFGPPFAAVRWHPRGGGFSGAAVFAGHLDGSPDPVFCLKSYPHISPDHLRWVHARIRQAAELSFVPRVFATPSGDTVVEADSQVLELLEWKPGVADFRDRPTDARLAAACRAVAELHRAWRPADPAVAPFPAVARRLVILRNRFTGDPGVLLPADVVRRCRAVLPEWADWAKREIAPWVGRPVPVQPCLCDVHHDHVLFTGDAVSGVIDYAATKLDHPAADLARLLGDLVGDDPTRLRLGLDAYHAAGGSPDVTAALVTLLDRTGVVCAAANWLLRLASGGVGADPSAVAVRLDRLVRRIEGGFGEARP